MKTYLMKKKNTDTIQYTSITRTCDCHYRNVECGNDDTPFSACIVLYYTERSK